MELKISERVSYTVEVEDLQELFSAEFIEAIELWLRHKNERKERYTQTGLKMLLKRLRKIGQERAIEAIEYSAAQNWAGIYEPKAPVRSGAAISNAERALSELRRVK